MKETLDRKSLLYKFYLYYDLYIKHSSFKKNKTYSQHGEDLFIFEMANNHQGSIEHGKNIIDDTFNR